MANTPLKQPQILRFLLTFAVIYLLSTTGLRYFFPERFQQQKPEAEAPLVLKAERASAPRGRNIMMLIRNSTDQPLTLPDRCPAPPLIIEKYNGEGLIPVETGTPVIPCSPPPVLLPDANTKIDLSPWKYAAFNDLGKYKISLPDGSSSADLTIKNTNVFVSTFRAFISKPLLNGLVLIASVLPAHSLGGSIILLTLLIKFLLFFPSQHALESQKKLQSIQPKIDELKKKHAGDQKLLTEETMKLWRAEKINPLQSCLPTLIQIPVLLGLFFIIRDSGHLELARHLLYSPFSSLDWTFHTLFLGFLDLARVPFEGITWTLSKTTFRILALGFPLPFITAALQFFQMYLAFRKVKTNQSKVGETDEKKAFADRLNPQTMMIYLLPIMIFFISGGLPAAVSLYWVASTTFAIGQQIIVNRKK